MSTESPISNASNLSIVNPVVAKPVVVVKAPKAPKPEKVDRFTIYQNAEGVELGRLANRRGKPRSDAIRLDNGDLVIKGCTMNDKGEIVEPATPSKVKADAVKAAKVTHYYIIMKKNDDGTESEVSRKPIGRGKPAAGFTKLENGDRVKYDNTFAKDVLAAPLATDIAEEIKEPEPFINSVPDAIVTEPKDDAIVAPNDPSIV
jgi:hypothetical protein